MSARIRGSRSSAGSAGVAPACEEPWAGQNVAADVDCRRLVPLPQQLAGCIELRVVGLLPGASARWLLERPQSIDPGLASGPPATRRLRRVLRLDRRTEFDCFGYHVLAALKRAYRPAAAYRMCQSVPTAEMTAPAGAAEPCGRVPAAAGPAGRGGAGDGQRARRSDGGPGRCSAAGAAGGARGPGGAGPRAPRVEAVGPSGACSRSRRVGAGLPPWARRLCVDRGLVRHGSG